MADKGPYGKASWNRKRQVHANHELCRPGTMPVGNAELNRGSGMPPANAELCRPGKISATMPEIDRGGFSGGTFIDRTAKNEKARENWFDGDNDLTPGHKQMAGMP